MSQRNSTSSSSSRRPSSHHSLTNSDKNNNNNNNSTGNLSVRSTASSSSSPTHQHEEREINDNNDQTTKTKTESFLVRIPESLATTLHTENLQKSFSQVRHAVKTNAKILESFCSRVDEIGVRLSSFEESTTKTMTEVKEKIIHAVEAVEESLKETRRLANETVTREEFLREKQEWERRISRLEAVNRELLEANNNNNQKERNTTNPEQSQDEQASSDSSSTDDINSSNNNNYGILGTFVAQLIAKETKQPLKNLHEEITEEWDSAFTALSDDAFKEINDCQSDLRLSEQRTIGMLEDSRRMMMQVTREAALDSSMMLQQAIQNVMKHNDAAVKAAGFTVRHEVSSMLFQTKKQVALLQRAITRLRNTLCLGPDSETIDMIVPSAISIGQQPQPQQQQQQQISSPPPAASASSFSPSSSMNKENSSSSSALVDKLPPDVMSRLLNNPNEAEKSMLLQFFAKHAAEAEFGQHRPKRRRKKNKKKQKNDGDSSSTTSDSSSSSSSEDDNPQNTNQDEEEEEEEEATMSSMLIPKDFLNQSSSGRRGKNQGEEQNKKKKKSKRKHHLQTSSPNSSMMSMMMMSSPSTTATQQQQQIQHQQTNAIDIFSNPNNNYSDVDVRSILNTPIFAALRSLIEESARNEIDAHNTLRESQLTTEIEDLRQAVMRKVNLDTVQKLIERGRDRRAQEQLEYCLSSVKELQNTVIKEKEWLHLLKSKADFGQLDSVRVQCSRGIQGLREDVERLERAVVVGFGESLKVAPQGTFAKIEQTRIEEENEKKRLFLERGNVDDTLEVLSSHHDEASLQKEVSKMRAQGKLAKDFDSTAIPGDGRIQVEDARSVVVQSRRDLPRHSAPPSRPKVASSPSTGVDDRNSPTNNVDDNTNNNNNNTNRPHSAAIFKQSSPIRSSVLHNSNIRDTHVVDDNSHNDDSKSAATVSTTAFKIDPLSARGSRTQQQQQNTIQHHRNRPQSAATITITSSAASVSSSSSSMTPLATKRKQHSTSSTPARTPVPPSSSINNNYNNTRSMHDSSSSGSGLREVLYSPSVASAMANSRMMNNQQQQQSQQQQSNEFVQSLKNRCKLTDEEAQKW